MTDFAEIDIAGKLEQIEQHGAYQHYKPLTAAADEFIKFSENHENRVWIGIQDLDDQIRGVAPGEFCVINGFAHNGKTVLATELLLHNEGCPLVLFTPDETRPAVLTKLAAATTGIGAEEMERRLYQRDAEARQTLLEVAERFHQLAVYDETISLHSMTRMFREAELAFGERPKGVLFDYASLLADEMDVIGKLNALKRWAKEHGVAFFCLHQNSRASGGSGAPLTMESVAYGGEQQATFMIGVRRKINFYRDQIIDLQAKLDHATNPNMIRRYEDRINEITFELIPRHRDTISVALLKNKRPPMRLVPEVDFKLDPDTGRISKIHKDDPDDLPDKPLDDLFTVAPSARGLLR